MSQQVARIAVDADVGTLTQRQQHARIQWQTTPAQLQMQTPKGKLEIDASAARDALGNSTTKKMVDRANENAEKLVMDAIAHIAQTGNRLAAIERGGDAIADLAVEATQYKNPYTYVGTASSDNVRIAYTAQPPQITATPGHIAFEVIPHETHNTYERGKYTSQMAQYNRLTITPPAIDVQV